MYWRNRSSTGGWSWRGFEASTISSSRAANRSTRQRKCGWRPIRMQGRALRSMTRRAICECGWRQRSAFGLNRTPFLVMPSGQKRWLDPIILGTYLGPLALRQMCERLRRWLEGNVSEVPPLTRRWPRSPAQKNLCRSSRPFGSRVKTAWRGSRAGLMTS